MSFLLPIVIAMALHFIGSIDLSSLEGYHFGVMVGDVVPETEQLLMRYGTVTAYKAREELVLAVNNPSTNMLRFEKSFDGFETVGNAYAFLDLCCRACSVELAHTKDEIEAIDRDADGEARERADVARSFLDVGEMTEEIWERFVKGVRVYPDGRIEVRWNFGDEMELTSR